MNTLTQYIDNKNKHHIHNIFINNEINEELNNLLFTHHGLKRKNDQIFKRATKNISNEELKDLFVKSDTNILNLCLNNKLINKQEFAIIKHEKHTWLSCICEIQNIDKTNLLYDINIISTNGTDYEYKVKDVKLYLKIENDGSIKTIYI